MVYILGQDVVAVYAPAATPLKGNQAFGGLSQSLPARFATQDEGKENVLNVSLSSHRDGDIVFYTGCRSGRRR
jgi:hypothetical protein